MPGTLFIVATPIGNLEDITARALRILREVALIAAEDTRRTAHLLTRYAITTPTTSLHEHNETRKAPALLARLQSGDSIALVSDAGTPLISDPGQHLIRLAIDTGLRIEAVPGPSAIMTALAASGFPTQPFVFLGFPPTRSKDRIKWVAVLKSSQGTAVFFEAPHRIRRTLGDIRAILGDIPTVIARELTKIHETFIRGPISAVLEDVNLEIGELTVVMNVGQGEPATATPPSDKMLADEFGDMTVLNRMTRRQAVQELAKKHGTRPNDVYAAVERARKFGK